MAADPTLYAAQGLEIAEKKCAVCIHRDYKVFDRHTCKKGLAWPKFGFCKGFRLDGGEDGKRPD